MKKIVLVLLLGVSFLFSAINLQTASKNELMSIKGIGPKKADQIIEYRKSKQIKSADDLKNIKGFGKGIISNVKAEKTVNKKKMSEKKKRAKIEDKRKMKIQKVKTSNKTPEQIKKRKETINKKAKEKKMKIKEKK